MTATIWESVDARSRDEGGLLWADLALLANYAAYNGMDARYVAFMCEGMVDDIEIVMAVMDPAYVAAWPSAARDWAWQLLAEATS